MKLVGHVCCLYTYPIQSFIETSEETGTPCGNRAVCSFWFVPAEMSVTVPSMTTVLPKVVVFGPTSTVV